MAGYSKPLSSSPILETDTLNDAIGKLEKSLDDKMDDGNYAGSSTNGGPATSAEKLSNTEQIGTNKKPVYFSADGIPVAIDHTINSDVPENAKFTDTKYSAGTGIRVADDTMYNMGILSVNESATNGCVDFTIGKNGTETSESKTIPVHGLGDAAYKSVDTVVTKDSANLITSGAVSAEFDKKMDSSTRNSANGVAGLDSNSKINVSQIPTTDEYNAESAYPVTGKAIEAAMNTLDIVPSTRKVNEKALNTDIILNGADIITTGYSKPTETSAITSSDTLNSAIGKLEKAMDGKSSTSHTHSSYVNQNAFSNVKVGDVTVAADSTTDTLTLASGTNVTITPDASTDTITISAKDTTYSAATTSVSGLMSADDKTKLDGIATGANKYTLPSASSSTLGGVKVGSNITISSGTISLTKSNVTSALGYTPINSTLKGANNGIAELDENGKVLTSQLPSYVDDVIEATALSSFPSAGEAGKIYVDASTNKTYRWSGSAYVEISASLALGETSSSAYRGDRGKVAYDHSQATHARTDATKVEASTTNGNIKINGTETKVYTHPTGTNPHGTTKSDVGLGNVPNVATNDQTPSYTEASSLAKLTSGEKLSVAFGKISKAVTDLISHLADSVKHITSTERTNWNAAKAHADSAHAPSSAQANVIETVKVNGTALTPSSKAVNITVPVTTDTYSSTGTAPVNGKAVASAIGTLDVAAVSVGTTETIKSISETDGKIAVTKQSIAIKSNQVNGMSSYSKATSSSAIATSDSLNTAVGKLEYKVDTNETNISTLIERLANVEKRVTTISHVYGFYIDGNNSNPSTRVTYIEDAIGMKPAFMNYKTDKFDYGSWGNAWFMPKPCMLKSDGTVAYYLDPMDYSKKIDGTESDISNDDFDGNAMMEWGTGGKKIWTKTVPVLGDPTSCYKYFADEQIDPDYHAYSFIGSDGKMKDHFYTPIYHGSVVGSKLRSLSGKAPCMSKTAQQEIDLATANGNGWYTEVLCDVELINDLLILIGKSLDTQSVFGLGNCDGFVNDSSKNYGMINSGTMNDKGLFWGKNTSVETDGLRTGVKIFGMENWWGNQWRRYAGMILDNGVYKIKKCYGTSDGSTTSLYNTTGNGYITTGITPTGTSGGYIKQMNYKYGVSIPSNASASSSTYYCDGLWFVNTNIRYARRGGHSSGGSLCGCSALDLNGIASVSYWSIGAALSFKSP